MKEQKSLWRLVHHNIIGKDAVAVTDITRLKLEKNHSHAHFAIDFHHEIRPVLRDHDLRIHAGIRITSDLVETVDIALVEGVVAVVPVDLQILRAYAVGIGRKLEIDVVEDPVGIDIPGDMPEIIRPDGVIVLRDLFEIRGVKGLRAGICRYEYASDQNAVGHDDEVGPAVHDGVLDLI